MSAAYYEQWDKIDLDSWQGKEIASIEGKDEDGEDTEIMEKEQDDSPSLENYGMCWADLF
jgi:hypothetical protein